MALNSDESKLGLFDDTLNFPKWEMEFTHMCNELNRGKKCDVKRLDEEM